MKITDFKVLSFDCYGTLIDWESGMIAGLSKLVKNTKDQHSRELTQNQILEAHARCESYQQKQTPFKSYNQILSAVYRRLAEEWNVSATWEEAQHYGNSIKNWQPFSDAKESLQYLKKYYKLVILSNVDNQNFMVSNEKLGVEFDIIYTAEDIGSYKPANKNFEYMLFHLKNQGIRKEEILHTAESMFHDHEPANRFGLTSCWIHRRHNQEGFGATMEPTKMPSYQFQFKNMKEMVEYHKKKLNNF